MSRRPDVMVVTGEPLWPSTHGGRIRSARMVEELSRHLAVTVVAPPEGCPTVDLPFEALPTEQGLNRLWSAVSSRPRLGRALLGPRRTSVVQGLVARHCPHTLLFTQSYLAAAAPPLGVASVVDFSDLEAGRMASLARRGTARSRLAHGCEATKARWWEPRVARRCVLASAATVDDVDTLSSWGARAVLVPNGADRCASTPSPSDGPVVFVASFGYRPNRDAVAFLLREVWPRLRDAEPGLCLRLVGRHAAGTVGINEGSDGVEVVSDPPTVDEFYRDAALVVAPVREGGGAQVKVTDALARGRVVVASTFSARSAPPEAGPGVAVADRAEEFAARVLHLWRHPDERWARERALVERRPVPTWRESCAPLVEALLPLVRPSP